jgi:hypothetical protein
MTIITGHHVQSSMEDKMQEIRSELHPYLAVVLRENGCFSLQVGGVEEHDRCQSGYDENYVWD